MNSAWGPPLLLAAALIWWICVGIYSLEGRYNVAAFNLVIAVGFSFLAVQAFRKS